MVRWTIESALRRWQEEGLLTGEKVDELRASLSQTEGARATRIFAALGGVLVGIGVILFVSSNWTGMGPTSRVTTLLIAYGAVVAAAMAAGSRGLPKVSEAIWLVATLVLGANIFLLAQIFNYTLTYWQGTLRWMVGAVVLGWALRSRYQAAVAVPLAIVTIGWLGARGGSFFGAQMEFLFSSGNVRPLLPLIGIGLVCLSVLSARSRDWAFAREATLAWGLMLIAIPLVIATADAQVAEAFFNIDGTAKQFIILAAVIVLLAVALVAGRFEARTSRSVLLATAAFAALLLVPVGGTPWVAARVGGMRLPFAAYVVVVFVVVLLAIWTGVNARNTRLINVGMASSAVLILIQYFSWSFALLDRSAVFVGGGLLLLGLSIVLEKKRRVLVAEATSSGGIRA